MRARRLRVLHVIESLARGGAETNLVSMVRRLPSNFEQHVVWLYDDDRLAESLAHHATLHPLKLGTRGNLLAAVVRLTGLIRQLRPDVVHAQLLRAQIVSRVAALLAGDVPVVTTWQNAFYESFALADFGGSRQRQIIVRAVDRLSGSRDRAFVAVSDYVAGHLSEKLGVERTRIQVIYNAVEPERHHVVQSDALAKLRSELRLPERSLVLLNVGRLVPQKAQTDLVIAMQHVAEVFPHAVLLIAGGGPLKERLRETIRNHNLEDRVRLLGVRSDISALLQLASLFVFPSVYEGLSVALVEAIANSLPAVVSDIPQNREVAGSLRSVRYAPVNDPTILGQTIITALEQLETLVAATPEARSSILSRFDAEVLANQLSAVFAKAASSAN